MKKLLDKKHVTFYARGSRAPLDVAERDVVLTYFLRVLSESLLPKLAFKGGTCLKKVYFGNVGRFSMDLDFTSSGISLEELKHGLRQSLDKRSYYDIEFKIAEENIRAGVGAVGESFLAIVHYAHSWDAGEFTKLAIEKSRFCLFKKCFFMMRCILSSVNFQDLL